MEVIGIYIDEQASTIQKNNSNICFNYYKTKAIIYTHDNINNKTFAIKMDGDYDWIDWCNEEHLKTCSISMDLVQEGESYEITYYPREKIVIPYIDLDVIKDDNIFIFNNVFVFSEYGKERTYENRHGFFEINLELFENYNKKYQRELNEYFLSDDFYDFMSERVKEFE